MIQPRPQAAFFDYGGVLAEEGYHQGLLAIAARHHLPGDAFFATVTEIIYGCGFVTGHTDEHHFWHLVREETGISGSDAELTNEILSRFVLRPRMITAVQALRQQGLKVLILSDQTDWLERLDRRDHFFAEFDQVCNSFRMGKTKRDASLFGDVATRFQMAPEAALFIDDNPGHIERATAQGWQTHLFTSEDAFFADLTRRQLWP
ncbi:MAG TPA: HAD family phosphatase [Desulfurivibrionaceae bacterium]|nr:HAD family phosphatase [Desulfurivibrionaceae bacterium]